MFRAYIKAKKKEIFLLVMFCAVEAVIFALYRLPVAAVAYVAAVCVFLGSIVIVLDYRKFAAKHRAFVREIWQFLAQKTEKAESGTVTEKENRSDPALLSVQAAALMEYLPRPDSLLEEDYRELVRALCEDRQALTQQQEQKYRELVEYYTIWVHQIKTPIAAMRLILQRQEREEEAAADGTVFADDAAGGIPLENGNGQKQELAEELRKIEQYVEMVLCYLRLDEGSGDYVIKEYDLDGIVRQAVRKNASVFIRKKIRLEYEPLNARVVTDEKWLLFVVEQVLSNALKYTPPKEGVISVTLETPKTLCIRDNGIGIAPEDLPRIFEKGYTGYNGRRDKKASGIGMYLSRRICHNLGHQITVASEPGKGTVVRLDLKNAELEVE